MGNNGIDISHWQGTINWNNVKTQDVNYVILKLSQVTTKDSKFESYYSDASKIYPVGCYIYNKVTSTSSAKLEAEFAVKSLNGRDMKCGVWLDLEDASMRNLGKSTLTNIIETEATILNNAGYSVGIYCNYDWYKNVLDSASLSKKYPFWIARYPSGDNGTLKPNLSPASCSGVIMWQYSSKGHISGINGYVDMNTSFTDIVEVMKKDKHIVEDNKQPGNEYDRIQFVKEVQAALGIKVDGIVGSQTLNATITVSKTVNNRHAVVKPIQKYLNYLGYDCGTVDGIAGSKFDNAVKQYQKKWMRNPDGEITKSGTTWKKMLGIA